VLESFGGRSRRALFDVLVAHRCRARTIRHGRQRAAPHHRTDGERLVIPLTRLRHGEIFYLNPDMFERVDSHVDTAIRLTDGTEYVVVESAEEIVRRIAEFRARIIALAGVLQANAFATVHHDESASAAIRRGELPGRPLDTTDTSTTDTSTTDTSTTDTSTTDTSTTDTSTTDTSTTDTSTTDTMGGDR
jgi:uncharacterized protein YlzI (FlbEa/FlbD family)